MDQEKLPLDRTGAAGAATFGEKNMFGKIDMQKNVTSTLPM